MMETKTAVVTGADGFIGSHLTETLLAAGYKVRALAQYNSFGSRGWLERVAPSSNLEVVLGDVRDPDFCRRLCAGAEVVFHLAALIAIPYSYVAPDSYVDTNIRGTLNMLQAARECQIERILITSTSEVYGTAQYVPIDEKHARQPQSPYSASKIGADALAMSFYNAFDTPVVIVRPFNTYGPRQSARAFIPAMITQIASGMRTIKTGDLTPTRDMNYVTDTARGFLALAEAPVQKVVGKEFNICTGKEASMREILEEISDIMGVEVKIETDASRLRPSKSEVFRLLGDNTLITTLTGWTPEVSLREGLKKTVEWFRDGDNMKSYKPEIYAV